MPNQHFKNVLELSFATLFISTAGVLGKYIDMPVELIIWWRAIIALVLLFMLCRITKIRIKHDSRKELFITLLSAVFLAGHWITYFYAIKLSNVSLGMLSMFTFPTITTILEPIISKTKFEPIHLLLGLMVLLGIFILLPEFNIENSDVKGIAVGVLSAIIFSLRNIILRPNAKKYSGQMIMMYQLLVVTIVVLPALFLMDSSNIRSQYPYIILLAIVSTVIGHSLFIRGLKHFSASTASIIVSTQPIFGIILAYLFLNEIPAANTFFGGSLIIATVIIESIISKKR